MSRRLQISALTAIGFIALAIGAFFFLRQHFTQRKLSHWTQRLARHGLTLRHSEPDWVGLFSLRFEQLHVGGPRGLELSMQGVQAEISPFAGGGLGSIAALDWDSLKFAAKGMAWEVEGTLRPAELGAMLRITQTRSPQGAPLQRTQARIYTQQRAGGLHVEGALQAEIDHRKFAPRIARLPKLQAACTLRPQGSVLRIEDRALLRAAEIEAEVNGGLDLSDGQLSLNAHTALQPFGAWVAALPQMAQPQSRLLCDVGGFLGMDISLGFPIRQPAQLRFKAQIRDSSLRMPLDDPRLADLQARARDPRLIQPHELPPAILRAILISEDAHFYSHRGFDNAIVEAAIVENIAQGRFVRGGGTISMQLARNTFLNQDKYLLRKAQEVFYTLLLERSQILTKDDILTLYINSIEWGPEIHGIRQAADFYFHKRPAELSTDEGLFLAAIIPNPKQYGKLLQPDGSLNDFAVSYFETMRWLLYEAELLPESELDRPMPVFQLLVGAFRECPKTAEIISICPKNSTA